MCLMLSGRSLQIGIYNYVYLHTKMQKQCGVFSSILCRVGYSVSKKVCWVYGINFVLMNILKHPMLESTRLQYIDFKRYW